jgi:hypothetical protein
MKNQVIKPLATALWLINNTKLTFKQIAEFCQVSETEIIAMADGFEKAFLEPNNPIKIGQLTQEEIIRCEAHHDASLNLSRLPIFTDIEIKVSKKSYTPISKRKDKISGALFLLQTQPSLPLEAIVRLTSATKRSVQALTDGTFGKIEEITPRDPVLLGLCTQVKLNAELSKIKKIEKIE